MAKISLRSSASCTSCTGGGVETGEDDSVVDPGEEVASKNSSSSEFDELCE
jgi:hypothetical protein